MAGPAVRLAAAALLASAMLGCAHVAPEDRQQHAEQLAAASGWQGAVFQTPHFPLYSFSPIHAPSGGTLTVYIEGDGLAWLSSNQPSPDPTPIRPMALQLALADGQHPVAYLARPCQFVRAPSCRVSVWTHDRFSPKVIEATRAAVDQLKAQAGAKQLVLVGYSGGGVLAALVAARRDDVIRLITVAAPLDHANWTQRMKVSPLSGSLNPADEADALRRVPQVHLVGGQDAVVPAAVVHRYAHLFPAHQRPQVVEIPDFNHLCCWPEAWASLLQRVRP